MSEFNSLELKGFITNSVSNVLLIKLIISTLQRCQAAKIAIRVVASAKQGEELKSFQEMSDIAVINTLAEAQGAM